MRSNDFSATSVAEHLAGLEKDYIIMYFTPVSKITEPSLKLRYSLHLPLIRNNLPEELLALATKIDFDKVQESTEGIVL